MGTTQQTEEPEGNLAEYVPAGHWLEGGETSAFFSTRASFDWFVKRHRQELIEDGSLITRAGRSGSLVSRKKFPKAVVRILKREALDREVA